MDVSDLAAEAVPSGDDLSVMDDAAADTGAQRHHDRILRAFSAALPGFAEGSDVGVISKLHRHAAHKV